MFLIIASVGKGHTENSLTGNSILDDKYNNILDDKHNYILTMARQTDTIYRTQWAPLHTHFPDN